MSRSGAGTSSTTKITPKRAKTQRRKKLNQDQRWASRSGKVVTRRIGDEKIDPPPAPKTKPDKWL